MLLTLLRSEFYPEVLHQHVKQLEEVFASLPADNNRGRTAVAMAVVAATASFVEGCVDHLLRQHLRSKVSNSALVDDLLKGHRGLGGKLKYAKKCVPLFDRKWQVEGSACQFVQGASDENSLIALRNKIDHGAQVSTKHLRLDDVGYFRRTACEYLEQVYSSFGDAKPGWLGT